MEKNAHAIHAKGKATEVQVGGDMEGQKDQPEHLVDELKELDG